MSDLETELSLKQSKSLDATSDITADETTVKKPRNKRHASNCQGLITKKQKLAKKQLREDLKQRNLFRQKKILKSQIKKKKYSGTYCKHSSFCEKIVLCCLMTLAAMLAFRQPPKINFQLAEMKEQQFQNRAVFEIVTDHSSQTVKFPIKLPQKLFFQLFQSTKSAQVKAKLNCKLGYEFENKQIINDRGQKINTKIQMSELKVLHFEIQEIVLLNKQNGIFNYWEFEDYEELKNYTMQHYSQKIKSQVLKKVTKLNKQRQQLSAKRMLSEMINSSQSWFNALLNRVGQYISFGLQPYLDNYINATQKQKIK